MEDSKPIIFDDGLREAFEHPLSEWPNLQNAIPSNPEKMDSVHVFPYKAATYFSVLRYLINHNSSFLQHIIKIFKHDYLKNIPDLTSHEIYEIVSRLSLNNSKVLLQQKFDLGVYTRLIDAIQKKDEKGFVDALDGCDMTGIMHILKILHVPIKFFKSLEAWDLNYFKDESDNTEKLYERFRFSWRKSLMDICGEDSREASRIAKSRVDFVRSIKDDSDLIKTINRYYSFLYGINCFLKKTELFDETEINVLEYILKSSPLQESYNQSRIFWENGIMEERFDELALELFGVSNDNGTLPKEIPQSGTKFAKRRKRKRLFGHPISNSDGRTNDSNVEDAEIIEDLQPPIDETIPQESQPEQSSAADYEQTFFPTHNSFEQETTMKDVPLYPDSKYGFIPEDYFNQKIDNAHPDDHYNLEDEIIDEGEEMFVGFVNYIAKHQYIENDNKTKALFAYRLSGRIRPNEEDIRAIPWWAPNKSPKELLYIIRYCVDKGSHKKFSVQMTDFFEGPDWPTEGYSTMADEADTNFRKALHAMYAVCGLKYTKPKKKKKW